ncbi:(deoxy)nucleoside triphosphate pyrophosphohydrolase [Carnobacterium divergens]|nr:(deoxy)nucleoside triphosphate pyrophosphohydrolase [Carnobacterium divergens]MDT1948726.1 (deoxy)nucleoside triphosphate pyrophosphohydrolase [Carnobacterium divergens]MDT1951207.1 (deoxy)nucleoside triphosphate pyrophosphohydrolase [Carnobacterium divergens]SBO16662.1 Mutator mutT protein [Carnobacterium divergens]
MMKKEINVVGAVIEKNGEILCAQRGFDKTLAGLWEFPGGKIEKNETPEQALAREITEELLCDISITHKITTTRYEYDFGVVILTTFLCKLEKGVPTLTEHQMIKWLPIEKLTLLEWAPADVPTIEKLIKGENK